MTQTLPVNSRYNLLFKTVCCACGVAAAPQLAPGHDITTRVDGPVRRHGWLFRHVHLMQHRSNRSYNIPTISVRGGGIIEMNPEFEEDETDATDDDSVEESSEDEETHQDGKHRLFKHSASHRIQSMFRQLHQNQPIVYILLALVAFRKDIISFVIQHNIIPTKLDETTGRRRLNIKWTTDGLKLLLVLQLIRMYFIPSSKGYWNRSEDDTINNATTDDGTLSSREEKEHAEVQVSVPIIPLLLFLTLLFIVLTKNASVITSHPYLLPILTSFVLRSLRNSNLSQLLSIGGKGEIAVRQAYIPQLEQHYTFEQLNERYFRDWAAWRKAFPVNDALNNYSVHEEKDGKHNNKRSSRDTLSSLLSSIMHPTESFTPMKSLTKTPSLVNTYPRQYNNGTVIILDMTKLDTQATRMENVRDQISFLMHLVENESDAFFSTYNSTNSDVDFASASCNNSDTNSTSAILEDSCNATTSTSMNTTRNATGETFLTHNSIGEIVDPVISPKEIEVIVLLESPGGAVSSYGLASSHLERLRSAPGVKLTICIDTVAASGGYMMACMASPGQLYCAPFAMVGSIGVIGQSLNVQKTLEKFGVRPYVFRGGRMKNPVGMIGEVTKEGVNAMQDMVDRIHDAFRDHVAKAREGALVGALTPLPNKNYFEFETNSESGVMSVIDQVANGDVFLGIQAKKLGLVDRLITSDDYISERIKHGARVLKLIPYQKPLTLSSLLMGPTHRGTHGITGLLCKLPNTVMKKFKLQ